MRAVRLKYVFGEVDQRAPIDGSLPLLAVSIHRGVERALADVTGGDSNYKVCQAGDLVINRMRAFQGSLGIAPVAGLVSPDYAVLRTLPGVYAPFLSYLLRSRWGVAAMTARIRGIGGTDSGNVRTPRINVTDLGEITAEIPDLDTQREIADLLDGECARIDELSGELGQLELALAQDARDWVSRAIDGMPTVRLRYRLNGIDQGWSPQCDERPAEAGEWGVLKVGCVNYGRFRSSENKRLPDDLEPRPEAEIRPGDLLMSRANTRELAGSAALVTEVGTARLMLSDKLYRLRLGHALRPEFAVLVLNSRAVRDQIEIATSGASSSMQNISQDLVRSLLIPDCSQSDQQRVIDEYTARRARLSAIDDEIKLISKSLTEYRDALITEAVTGTLAVAA